MFTLQVTQQHLDEGLRKNSRECAVHLALRPYINPSFKFRVQRRTLVFYKQDWLEKGAIDIFVPRELTNLIADWDDGKYIEPFTVELDLPQEVLNA